MQSPDPDVGIQQELHFRTFQRLNAPAGPVMSPMISIESLAQPSHDAAGFAAAGITSATGRPKRVTLTGAPVRRTSSSTARHVALNLEIAISRIFTLYHSHRPWSECQVLNLFGGAGQIRRKPGTDTKFPAQFAGNWLSVPGRPLAAALPPP